MQFHKILSLILLGFTASLVTAMDQIKLDYYHKATSLLIIKDFDTYYQVKSKLVDTPLYTFLQYKEIIAAPDLFHQKTIDEYLRNNKDSFWEKKLKEDLANYYLKESNWINFLYYYDNNLGFSGKCYKIFAEYNIGNHRQALNNFTTLWLSHSKLPQACGYFEEEWKSKVKITEEQIALKSQTLAFSGYLKEAFQLIQEIENKDLQIFYEFWIKTENSPFEYLDDWIIQCHDMHRFDLALIKLLAKISHKNVYYAEDLWLKCKQKHLLSEKTINFVNSEIAINYARIHSEKALQWLQSVQDEYSSHLLWQWRLRTSIYWKDYSRYLIYYNKLPPSLKEKDEWIYWQAKSYQALQKNDESEYIFNMLAKKTNYYGFLAADELSHAYVFNMQSAKISPEVLSEVDNNQNISQILDLYQLGECDLSYSLWQFNLKKLTNDEKLAMAKLASQRKNYQISVSAYANGGANNDLLGLYPLAFWSEIFEASKNFDVNPDLIISIMRQESAFRIHSVSSAGAQGLMQLLPETAKFLSKKYQLEIYKEENLYEPSKSINLGAANLKFLNHLNNHNGIVIDIAAYNAGLGNVKKWLPPHMLSADEWIEIIPFGETRQYIKNVLRDMVIYNHVVLGNDDFQLKKLMQPISLKKFNHI